jgi:hypothetical protein
VRLEISHSPKNYYQCVTQIICMYAYVFHVSRKSQQACTQANSQCYSFSRDQDNVECAHPRSRNDDCELKQTNKHRRDRRHVRRGGRGVAQGKPNKQARGGLHCRHNGASREAHGTRRSHYFGRKGHCGECGYLRQLCVYSSICICVSESERERTRDTDLAKIIQAHLIWTTIFFDKYCTCISRQSRSRFCGMLESSAAVTHVVLAFGRHSVPTCFYVDMTDTTRQTRNDRHDITDMT